MISTVVTKNIPKLDSKNLNKNIEVAVRMRPILQEFEDQEVWEINHDNNKIISVNNPHILT